MSTPAAIPDAGHKDELPALMIRHRTLICVGAHAAAAIGALFLSFVLVYTSTYAHLRWEYAAKWMVPLFLPLVLLGLPIKLLVFYRTGQYRASWRYVGLRDLFSVISSSLIASFFFLGAFFIVQNFWEYRFGHELIAPFPALVEGRLPLKQPVFLLDWSLTLALICTMKVVVRFYFEEGRGGRDGEQRRVLIAGAGSDAESLLREMLRMRGGRHTCVGLVAGSTTNHGVIHGVEILGTLEQLRELCTEHKIDEVLIALPNATPRVIRGLVEQCEGLGVLFRTVPPVTDLIAGRVTVSQVRDVDIADLLGRAEVELDEDGIGQQLRGRCVLVTGAGGSIGSEMCRQIAKFSPSRLILIEQAENVLFEIDREIRKQFPELDVVPYVADVIDRPRLGTIFGGEKPSVVFHAAAHKHVPMMERNPGEAIKNNVMGTIAVADMAAEHGVARMVMISTDKAVNPTSIMGCTKRVAEIYVQALNGRVETQYVTVRFGNVLGSSGSVVPIFKKQIAAGGPITVTHPDMTRYFMTIPEAAQLVLQAGTMGNGGEIYVLHMGEPVKIVDLARDMITLSGLKPGTDIEIEFSGIRPGEKLFEELMIDSENISETSHPKIGIWRPCLQEWDAMLGGVQRLKALVDDSTNGQIQEELGRIVPEYHPGDPAPAPSQQAADADAVTQT